MAVVADAAFDGGVVDSSVLFMWLGALAYTLQIYFDFSGYSDMAIGLGRLFGFHFTRNFDYPYAAISLRTVLPKISRLIGSVAYEVIRGMAYIGLYVVSVSYLVIGAHNPFIYFNF